MIYTDPRRKAVIQGWPSGPRRVTARFWIEPHPKRGERVCRQTAANRPKKSTYARRCVIVTGVEDGRTYFLQESGSHITVCRGDMRYAEESRFPKDEGFADLVGLLEAVS